MTSQSPGVQPTLIVGLCVFAAVAYGIAHDNVTARLCVEYFTIGHPRIIESQSPTALAFAWGFAATWWVGAILGVIVALAARAGRPPRIDARDLVVPVGILMAAVGAIAFAAGWVGLVSARGGGIPAPVAHSGMAPETQVWFTVDLWAHGAAYLAAFAGGFVLAVSTGLRRRRPARPPPERR